MIDVPLVYINIVSALVTFDDEPHLPADIGTLNVEV